MFFCIGQLNINAKFAIYSTKMHKT